MPGNKVGDLLDDPVCVRADQVIQHKPPSGK
jgi:hypothetical protein